jgi:chromosome segregation ATPase
MPVDYDLTGQAVELLQSLDSTIASMAKSIDAANALKEAEAKLTAEQKKLEEQARKLKEAQDKQNKSFGDAAEVASNVKDVLGGVFEAAGELAGGFAEMVREVTEAREELAGFMDAADRDTLDTLADRLEAADKAVMLLKADVVTELSPGIETMIDTFLGAADKVGGFIDKLYEMQVAGKAALSWITFGASDQVAEMMATFTEDGELAREEIELLIEAEKEWNDAIEEGERLAEEWAEQAKEGAAEAKKALDEERKALEKLQASEEKYREWYRDQRLDAIEADAQAASEYIAGVLERNEEELEAWKELQAEKAKEEEEKLEERKEAQEEAAFAIAEAWTAAIGGIADLMLEHHEGELEHLEMRRKRTRSALKDAEDADKDRLENRLENIKEEEQAQKEAARNAFAVSQAAAIANVVASGAAAFAAMLLTFAPLGFGAPLAAGAVVVPSVALQIASISKNKPPAHSGAALGADEFFVGDQLVRQGERAVVYNQRAVERGAVDRGMAENRDQGATAPQVVVMADAGRIVGAAWLSEAGRAGSPLARAVGSVPRGFVNPYRRRRG